MNIGRDHTNVKRVVVWKFEGLGGGSTHPSSSFRIPTCLYVQPWLSGHLSAFPHVFHTSSASFLNNPSP